MKSLLSRIAALIDRLRGARRKEAVPAQPPPLPTVETTAVEVYAGNAPATFTAHVALTPIAPREEVLVPLTVVGGSKIFRYRFEAKPYWLYDAIFVRGQYLSALRVSAAYPGAEEPILYTLINPRYGEQFMLLGVHDHRAEAPVDLVIESSRPFIIDDIWATFKRPAFRREDGMVIFHDPFYAPVSEGHFLGYGSPHHRKLYGPGIDIGYR